MNELKKERKKKMSEYRSLKPVHYPSGDSTSYQSSHKKLNKVCTLKKLKGTIAEKLGYLKRN